MITLFYFLWYAIQLYIGLNLIVPLLFSITYGIRKLFYKKRPLGTQRIEPGDYAVIVTAYEQTDLLPTVVSSLLQMRHDRFMVYVVADKCDISGLHFSDPRVVLLRPDTVLSSNTKSHFHAIEHFVRNHDRLTIIDSDNLVEADYLNQLDACFARGYEAVQGVRKPKNTDGLFASLDAARDVYYHYYDGEVLFGLGSSATLAGSGMAFKTSLYRACLEHREIKGAGFDKVLQYELVSRNKRIAYAGDAVVYDEKTSRSGQLVNQRARWINTWFKYFGFGFKLIGKGLRNFSLNQLLFGIVLLRPPLFIFLILSLVFMIVQLAIEPLVSVAWIIGLMLFVAGFLLSLFASKADRKIFRALVGIPVFIFYQLLSLLKARRANKVSVATRHFATGQNDMEKS